MSDESGETSRSDTKYGDKIDDHEWEEPEPEVDTSPRTTVKNHEIDVIHTYDPSEDMGYGRKRYTANVSYDDEDGPYVLYVVEHKWKGNFWRDVTDLDWQDTPEIVRRQVAAVLSVDSPEDLESGVRLMDEGGESRWKKYHKPRVEETSGSEIWGVSSLKDSLRQAESAAESFEDGSENEELAERLVSVTRGIIKKIDGGSE